MTLPEGKLPPAQLSGLLAAITRRDARVVHGPGIGRDAAVIRLGNRLLVAASDPVTFATEHAGWYGVHVNANDVACMGADPAWFLATILLPPGSDASLASSLFREIDAACAAVGAELVGGHTEVTSAVNRPVVSGTMLGEIAGEAPLPAPVQPGDVVLMTKAIAIEGTALLAREAARVLEERGVDSATIGAAAALLFEPGISVVPEARALRAASPRLMHDPTEGGIATALHEMAAAAEATLRVDASAIATFDETRRVCAALDLDPFGLLASGALLAIVPPDRLDAALAALSDISIACQVIGQAESGPPGVIMGDHGSQTPFPSFERDELARHFESVAAQGQPHPEGNRE